MNKKPTKPSEKPKAVYMQVLNSGMFYEWHPKLKGEWIKDKIEWRKIYKKIR